MQKYHLECNFCDANSISFISHCTPEERDLIVSTKSCSHYKKGQTLFYEHNIPLGVYCISKGVLKLTRSNKDGKEQIVRFAKAGEFLGYRAIIAEEPLVVTATCVDETICCFIPKFVFLKLVEKNPEINKLMMKSLCHELGLADERIQSMAQKSVRERLAETLLFLNMTFNDAEHKDPDVINIVLPREDIANIVGTATETVIRLLSEFKAERLIDMDGKRIRILNKAGLEKISHASV